MKLDNQDHTNNSIGLIDATAKQLMIAGTREYARHVNSSQQFGQYQTEAMRKKT